MLYTILKAIHLLSMATWFGALLFTPGDIRRTLQAEGSDISLLGVRVSRATKVGMVSGLATLFSGIALIFSVGGMGAVPPAIHIGLLTTMIAIAVAGLIGRTWGQVDAALQQGTSRAQVLPMAKRVSMFAGIFQLLWFVTFGLMLFRNGF